MNAIVVNSLYFSYLLFLSLFGLYQGLFCDAKNRRIRLLA